MGRAADRPEWIVDPWQVVAIIDRLAALQLRVAAPGGIDIVCGNNLGYYGPHEVVMRSRPGGPAMHWGGCGAGINLIGIESDGTIKGCPSLPTEPYRAGNILELTIEDIWLRSEEMSFARDRDGSELWGHCRDCYYASECQGGCSWMAHAALGRRGNNPFCYHRVNELRQRGLRERLVLTGAAPQEPYDTARFALIEEPWDAELPADQAKPARRSLPVL